MELLFLGGAESIGASATYLELDGARFLVDCGVRVKGTGTERLPDLSLLEDRPPPAAALVTHAHLDHIGALPVLHQRYPTVPVFATPPTIDLVRIQLYDSLRIMEDERLEGELPLYSRSSVESLLARLVPVRPLEPLAPIDGGPEVTFLPSGHILGACSVAFRAREGNVFLSGDVSVDPQRTIAGMRPPRFRADVAVFESTYGNRSLPPRSREEERLVATVAETVAQGGKVLIPAFAIGRAQEVLLILMREQLANAIPRFPIFVDGMIRRTCTVYAAHPCYLRSSLRKRIEKHGDPFFGVLEDVRPVRDASDRHRIVEGDPCVVIASSGMLSGGPSPFYARAFASDERNLIAVTGYQDEEAPGRRLLEAARGERETITIDGHEVAIRARVSTYGLSGHASGSQLASIAHAVDAADVFLVHGDAEARRELGDVFLRERLGRIHIPFHGIPASPAGRRVRRDPARESLAARSAGLRVSGVLSRNNTGIEGTDDPLEALAASVREHYDAKRSFRPDELHYIAFGGFPAGAQATERFEVELDASPFFHRHPERLFEFRVADEGSPESAGDLPVQSLMERLDRALPPDAMLLKKSYPPSAREMTLIFAFPDVVREKYAELIDSVFRDTEWTYTIHPLANPNALCEAVLEEIPDPNLLARSPALHVEERRLVLALVRALAEAEREIWNLALRRIGERTGFEAELEVIRTPPRAKATRDASGRMEINLAYDTIRQAFREERHQPYRIGKKPEPSAGEESIELAFISPEIGRRYDERIRALSRWIGWPIHVSKAANMNAILDVARRVFRDRSIRKGPSLRPGEARVAVVLATPIDPETLSRLERELADETGYLLTVTT